MAGVAESSAISHVGMQGELLTLSPLEDLMLTLKVSAHSISGISL